MKRPAISLRAGGLRHWLLTSLSSKAYLKLVLLAGLWCHDVSFVIKVSCNLNKITAWLDDIGARNWGDVPTISPYTSAYYASLGSNAAPSRYIFHIAASISYHCFSSWLSALKALEGGRHRYDTCSAPTENALLYSILQALCSAATTAGVGIISKHHAEYEINLWNKCIIYQEIRYLKMQANILFSIGRKRQWNAMLSRHRSRAHQLTASLSAAPTIGWKHAETLWWGMKKSTTNWRYHAQPSVYLQIFITNMLKYLRPPLIYC